MDFISSSSFPNEPLISSTFLEHFCHHLWVVQQQQQTHPKVMTEMFKICSTDQRFIRKRNITYKIGNLGVVNKLLKQKFVDISQQCLALLPKITLPAHNLNFYLRWWDRIQAIFLKIFSTISWILWKNSCHKELFSMIDLFVSRGNQNLSPSPSREIVCVWKYKFDFNQTLVSFLLFLFS